MGNNPNNYNEEEKELKSSYYKLLSKNIKNRYEHNHNNLSNQSYCFIDRDFEKSYINQRISEIPTLEYFVPWKFYLLKALNSFEKDKFYLWAGSLYPIILEENFHEQIKFQNLFFYQEAQISSNLKIDITNNFGPEDFGYTNTIKENDYITNIDDPLLVSMPDDPFYFVKYKINNTLMASFISGSDSFGSSVKKDPNKEHNFNKRKIKAYMEVFKQHLSFKEHPINFVILKFCEQFIPKINEAIDNYKMNYKIKKNSCDEKAQDIIKQLQDFILLMQVTLKLFYARSISYIYFKDEKDEFINLISLIIFNNKEIYSKFFELFDLMNKENQEKLEQKFELLGDLNPEDVGIKPEFCLNQVTKDLMEKLKKEKINEKKDDNNLDKDNIDKNEEDINTKPIKEEGEEDINEIKLNIDDISASNEKALNTENLKVTSDTGKLNNFTEDLFKSNVKFNSNEPYYEAILYIKKINDFKVPLHKLIVIASLSTVITGCVNKFWKNMDNIIRPEMLSIDSDELLTIFIYIIYKCKISSFFVHADFINYFLTPTTKSSSMIGYYYITFKGALDFLLSVKTKEDFKRSS